MDSLSRVYEGDGAFLLGRLQEARLEYRAQRDGYFGTLVDDREIIVRQSTRLDELVCIEVVEGPALKLASVRVEITKPGQQKAKVLKRGDLVWGSVVDDDTKLVVLDRQRSVALVPGVSRGDRLRITLVFECRGVHGLPTLTFDGRDLVCAHWISRLVLPTDHRLAYEVIGPDSLRGRLSYEGRQEVDHQIHTWAVRDLRPARDESAEDTNVAPRLSVVPHVTGTTARLRADAFAISESWEKAARGYDTRVAASLEPTPEILGTARAVVAGAEDKVEILRRLFAHVQATTRYLGLYEGLAAGVVPVDAGEVQRNGYGDCKGLSAYLISLCRAAGIEAAPVLVRTREEGPLATTVSNMAQFNHCIVWADDGRGGCWLDPTLRGFPAGLVTLGDAAWPVLRVSPESAGLCEIPRSARDPGCSSLTVNGLIESDNTLRFDIALATSGVDGASLNAAASRLPESEWSELIAKILLPQSVPARRIAVQQIMGEEPTVGCRMKLTGETVHSLPSSEGRLFLPKVLPPLPSLASLASETSFDGDLRWLADREESWSIQLPTGLSLAAPDSLVIEGPCVAWRRVAWQDGARLRLTRSIEWTAERVQYSDILGWRSALGRAQTAEAGFLTLIRR